MVSWPVTLFPVLEESPSNLLLSSWVVFLSLRNQEMVGVGVPLALQVKVTLPWRPWLMIITMLCGGISTVGLSVYREIWNGEILYNTYNI